jgi:hypothetical protein
MTPPGRTPGHAKEAYDPLAWYAGAAAGRWAELAGEPSQRVAWGPIRDAVTSVRPARLKAHQRDDHGLPAARMCEARCAHDGQR